jgi:hypothetical protein
MKRKPHTKADRGRSERVSELTVATSATATVTAAAAGRPRLS